MHYANLTHPSPPCGRSAARRRRRGHRERQRGQWGLGTEAPTRAEVESIWRQQGDLLRKLGTKAPAAAGTQTPTARQRSRYARYDVAFPVVGMVLAIAGEAPAAVFWVLRVARAVQRRRPRIAAGSALVVAGSVARLRAASAEP